MTNFGCVVTTIRTDDPEPLPTFKIGYLKEQYLFNKTFLVYLIEWDARVVSVCFHTCVIDSDLEPGFILDAKTISQPNCSLSL